VLRGASKSGGHVHAERLMPNKKSDPARVPEPLPENEEDEQTQVDGAELREGVPPGVSFDTPAGRRAQGMDPDIGNRKPNEEPDIAKECEGED
jgi:hypothetical protein